MNRPALAQVPVVAVLLLLLTAPVAAAVPPAGHLRADGPSDAVRDAVSRYLSDERDALHLPGVSVVVLREGRAPMAENVGVAGPDGRPVTSQTPFLLGSTSKQLTGLMVQQLIRQGRLSLDTTAHEVLPWFGTGSDRRSRVTVRELLTHSAGISTRVGLAQWGWRLGRAGSITAGARAISEADLTAPGRFEYSNAGYDVLGAMVEAVTKEPYARALDELVSAPLGLRSTTADLTDPPPGLATGYYVWLGRLPLATPAPPVPSAVPSSMIVSTADDLTRVVRAHLGSGGALGPALVAARTPMQRVNQYAQYASGWFVRPLWELHGQNADPIAADLPVCIEHDGETDRSMSYLLACPSLGLGVVALADAAQGPDSELWTRFHSGLVHAVLGTVAATSAPDPVIRYAPAIFVGVPGALALALAAQVRAVRRRRHVLGWSAPALLLGLGALWLGYAYAPGRGGGGPLLAMWSSVPDLAASTALATLLTTASLVVLIVARLRRAGSRVRRRHLAQEWSSRAS